MTNTDEAFRKYCETHGPCNRVVFDNAFAMGMEAAVDDMRLAECQQFRCNAQTPKEIVELVQRILE